MESETATGGPAGEAETVTVDPDDIEREIGHDEFDPVGTLTLILVYLAILVLLWVFMYFVEFLGRGLTVVG